MGGEWPTATVTELQREGVLLVEDGNHGEYRPRPDEFVGAGVAFIRAADMNAGRVLFESAARINEKARARITKGIGKPGDILLSHKGTVGKLALVSDDAPPFVCSPQTTFWRTLDESRLDRRYLYAFLRSSDFRAQLATRAGETDMAPYVSLTSQRGLTVALPPISTQRALAHILGSLDDKIELNRRMSESLEAIAGTLFKSWFVDFDPVRAKAEGRETGLLQRHAELFPDSFEDSEFAEVPKGWGIAPLSDVIAVNPARPLKKGDVAPYLDMANMPTRGHTPDEVIERPFGSGMRFKNGDTLVARITPCLENGKTAYVDFLEADQVGWGSTEYIVLCPKPPLPAEFAYCLARGDEFREFAIQSMTGSSGRQRVPAESLSHFLVVTPPNDVAAVFGHIVRPLFERASRAANESRVLAATRDNLVPELVTGRIRIPPSEGRGA